MCGSRFFFCFFFFLFFSFFFFLSFCFFFFKQKTAYEIYQCDWSSDVCSSDLYAHPLSTGPLEGINNKIKTMKRQSYGFRNREYFKLKILAIHRSQYALVG